MIRVADIAPLDRLVDIAPLDRLADHPPAEASQMRLAGRRAYRVPGPLGRHRRVGNRAITAGGTTTVDCEWRLMTGGMPVGAS